MSLQEVSIAKTQKCNSNTKKFASSLNSTLVIVTHDSSMAADFDHQFFMQDGRVKELPALPLN